MTSRRHSWRKIKLRCTRRSTTAQIHSCMHTKVLKPHSVAQHAINIVQHLCARAIRNCNSHNLLWFNLLSRHAKLFAEGFDFVFFFLFWFRSVDNVLRWATQRAVKDFFCSLQAHWLGCSGVHQGLKNKHSVLRCGVELGGFVSASNTIDRSFRKKLTSLGRSQVVLDFSNWSIERAGDFVE